ncbi:hypothetical protein [Actinospica sp.]|jgi:hypothetical protein|uniref:hypothetical protein n=1 Tax=Actinospica sp. TaxID=1872142 RepID=UPI002B6B5B61|nr:hypothetical protein [Actinospica sp.]HWG25230.1 hypothetical protein [Actinospica sp.]
MRERQPSAGENLAAAEAAACAAAMDGLAALQEFRDHRLISDALYQAHAAAALRRLDSNLTVPVLPARRTVGEVVTERYALERHRSRATYLLQPPSSGPLDALPPQLVADAAYLLITRCSGSAVLLSEHLKLGSETLLRLLARLIELNVIAPAGTGRHPLHQPIGADAVRDRVLKLCEHEARRAEPRDATEAQPPTDRRPVPPELLIRAGELIISAQFGSTDMPTCSNANDESESRWPAK